VRNGAARVVVQEHPDKKSVEQLTVGISIRRLQGRDRLIPKSAKIRQPHSTATLSYNARV
jgi:hypothetical protein